MFTTRFCRRIKPTDDPQAGNARHLLLDKTVKPGARNKKMKAGRNRDYLRRVLLSPVDAK